jgi:hypothetical protein
MKRSTGRSLLGAVLALAIGSQLGCGRSNVNLDNDDSGRTVALSAGEELDITLGSIGNQGEPSVSANAIRFDGSDVIPPFNPGGPKIRYRFTAAARGQATITIPFLNPSNPPPFTVDVNVE